MAVERTSRRSFLSASAGILALPLGKALGATSAAKGQVRFGVITDVHHGLATRTESRLEEFLARCSERKLDFIIQMGDFHHPVPEAKAFLNLWHTYKGPRYGVLGNHDMDMGTKAQQVENWRIPGRYYSFDSGFLHFVVLDANFMRLGVKGPTYVPDEDTGKLVAYEKGNWYRAGISASWIDPEQRSWLKTDLEKTQKPTVVFVHQPLDDIWEGGSVPNREEIRKVLEDSGKVVAVLQGHDHQDASEMRNGIFYWRVNSASYAWVGENYGRMADYDRSLFAFVEIAETGSTGSPGRQSADGQRPTTSPQPIIPSSHQLLFRGEGRRGIFEGDSPFTRGVPNPDRFASSITSVEAKIDATS